MDGIRMSTSSVKSHQGPRTTGAGNERVKSQSTNPPAKAGLPPLGPGLQRVDSNPARLPSNTPQRPEAKPIQGISEGPFRPGKLSRTESDIFSPIHFGRSPVPPPTLAPARATFLGIPFPFGKSESSTTKNESSTLHGSKLKEAYLEKNPYRFKDFEPSVTCHPDLMEIIKERYPNYDEADEYLRDKAMDKALKGHPKYLAEQLYHLNAINNAPTAATATRTMTEVEHKFLAGALHMVSEDVHDREFHIHGESSVIGNEKGELTHFHHEPRGGVKLILKEGDKYNLHTHPPFEEPATSAASVTDHKTAAFLYSHRNGHLSYVTNGKDVLHIQPDSMELVKLKPNPEMVKRYGEFPVGFMVPKPAQPPYPFFHHEAPTPDSFSAI
jgi:hypothetical protein